MLSPYRWRPITRSTVTNTCRVISNWAAAIFHVNHPCTNFITLHDFDAVNCVYFLHQFSAILSLQNNTQQSHQAESAFKNCSFQCELVCGFMCNAWVYFFYLLVFYWLYVTCVVYGAMFSDFAVLLQDLAYGPRGLTQTFWGATRVTF